MRRLGLVVIGVWVAVFGLVTPAVAEPSPTAAAPGSAAETVCTPADSRQSGLTGLTGLAALSDGGYVMANTSDDQTARRVYYLDSKCRVNRPVSYGSNPARDPQDLAVASDGTVWVADTGDNSTSKTNRRDTIALWKVPTGTGNPVIHRLAYPDGEHHDARALLFGAGDTPVIVTKETNGPAQIFQPTEQLQPGKQQGVPLKKVGEWSPKRTGTPNFLGPPGQLLVTGAAQSPDRKRVALRTYSDAYEWTVADGDVVKAIATTEPRVTPLIGLSGETQGERQGEAIAYSADGKSFLTGSGQAGSKILRYQPAAAASVVPVADKPAPKTDGRSWYQTLSLPQIINIVAAVGVLGLVLVVVGVMGIRRSRRARRRVADETPTDPPAKTKAKGGGGKGSGSGGKGSGSGGNGPPAPVPGPGFSPPMPAPGSVDPRRQGRGVVMPPQPPAGGRAQPGRAGAGGGVYGGGGGYSQPGYDRRAGHQDYSQPGYQPDFDGDGRYYPERL